MSRESQTVNNYIYGGAGGPGGAGHNQGQGGRGGAGDGPTLNYSISAEHFAVNNHIHGSGIDILHRTVALEALHNSAESFPQPKCNPQTRTKLVEKLYDWVTDPGTLYSVHWLHGPAGAGKSAVMQTLCQQLEDAGRLGGSFFFKRDHPTRGNARVLFATLAYQLALHRRELKSLISQCIDVDPSVLARGMDVQLHNLILEPCKLLQDAPPLILLIDGLDECNGHNIQQEILHLIGSTSDHCFRILVASRPEPHIREIFKDGSLQGLSDSTNIEQSFEDIRTYLRHEFSRIYREHSAVMRNIPTPWPTPQVLEMLVKKSSGYFIYASTVIKFVDDKYSRPTMQLDIIQNIGPHNSESPFQALDQLYNQILSGVPMQYHPRLCDILSVIINYPAEICLEDIDELLGYQSGDVSLILHPLHSVLKLGSEKEDVEVHHASFRDFLRSPERSSIFYVGSPQHRAQLARSILKALAYTHDNKKKNQANIRLCWHLSGMMWIDYITSVPPSPEFVPLIRLVNPDFIFVRHSTNVTIAKLLFWLKFLFRKI
ncbi:putative nwd2 protein [Mycena venus]|uniref:Putative nwd2 protein n=1 Tax=Mycena venus TaxID=2733690 RepID=A0A8H6XK59_9AGAR|nr:putative nwd2 protein [Mycena venus]